MLPKNPKKQSLIPQNLIELMKTSKQMRQQMVWSSHELFARTYLSHYFTYPFAEFHARLFAYTEDPKWKFITGVAFRNSGKTSILTVSLPIWSITGAPQKKCVLIIGQTQNQVKQYLSNIKAELTYNPLLVQDLGPFEEQNEEWNSGAIVIKQYGAKIIAFSREQSIRGFRYLQNRPDLIICDDVEDIDSTRTQQSRDANYEWYTSEVIPCGDEDTQYVYVGNLVHEDCVLERLRIAIEDDRLDGVYFRIPLLDDQGNPTWPGRFKDQKAIDRLHNRVPNENAWQREYMLRIVDDQARLLRREQIQYYDALPKNQIPQLVVLGTDLAVSNKITADLTALVAVAAYGSGKNRRLFVLPGIVNAHMMLHESVKKIVNKVETLEHQFRHTEVLIEDVGFQEAVYQDLREEGLRAKKIPLRGMSKRERLELPASSVDLGQVLFPRIGAEVLIDQLVNFGYGGHDDLCDAFSIAVNYLVQKSRFTRTRVTSGDWYHIDPPREVDEESLQAEIAAEDKIRDDHLAYIEARALKRKKEGLPREMWYRELF